MESLVIWRLKFDHDRENKANYTLGVSEPSPEISKAAPEPPKEQTKLPSELAQLTATAFTRRKLPSESDRPASGQSIERTKPSSERPLAAGGLSAGGNKVIFQKAKISRRRSEGMIPAEKVSFLFLASVTLRILGS
jgi:hypothetical protein